MVSLKMAEEERRNEKKKKKTKQILNKYIHFRSETTRAMTITNNKRPTLNLNTSALNPLQKATKKEKKSETKTHRLW